MATRFYIARPGSADDVTPPISPSWDASWEKTSSGVRVRARTTVYTSTTGSDLVDSTGTGSDPNDVGIAQCVSIVPYAPQVISGFFKSVFRAREFNAGTNARAQCTIRAIALNGVTVLATLVSHDTSALSNEFVNGTAGTIRFPLNYTGSGVAVSATIASPFYVVAEFGARIHSTDSANAARLAVGINDAGTTTDASETEGTTSAAVPWFEFSQDLVPYMPRNRPVMVQDVGVTSG